MERILRVPGKRTGTILLPIYQYATRLLIIVAAAMLVAVCCSGCIQSARNTPPRPTVDTALGDPPVDTGPLSVSATEDGSPVEEPNATIEEVIDGDTIIIRSRGDRERVRLIGIDTPETVHPTKPVECFGPEASEHTKSLLPGGTPVRLLRDIEARDRYGRLLAYVYRSSDGLFVNLDLVLGGFAESYRFPPNETLSVQFARAEALARHSGIGMWSECRQ